MGNKYAEKDHRDPHTQNLQPNKAFVGSTSSQRSGAYIFRPADDEAHSGVTRIHAGDEPVQLTVVEAESVSEVRQVFSEWASQTVRVRQGSELVELEWTVGPVPIDDFLGKNWHKNTSPTFLRTGTPRGPEILQCVNIILPLQFFYTFSTRILYSCYLYVLVALRLLLILPPHPGREVISRFDTTLDSEHLIYSDANGREFQEHLMNFRSTWDLRGGSGESEPIGGNYYPVTAAAYIKDTAKGFLLFTVLCYL